MLLAPFEVFSHAILAAELFPDLVCWGAAALAIDARLAGPVFKLDADYLESAAAISQKLYEKVQRMKQGGGIVAAGLAEGGEHPPAPGFPGWAGPGRWRGGRC